MAATGVAQTPIPTYYPSSTGRDSATVLTLTPSATQSGVEIRLRKSSTVTVSGKVDYQPAPGVPTHISVQLAPVNGMDRLRSRNHTMAQPDGAFHFGGVTPGEYVLWVHVSANKPEPNFQLTARTQLQVNADVTGIVVTPRAPVSVSGRLKNEGLEAELGKMTVVLVAQGEESGFGAQGHGPVNHDGRFAISNIAPERYRLRLQGATDDHYLKSAASAGRDLLKDGMDLTASGAENLEITIASDGGTIEGVLEDAKMPPGTMALVALWPTGDHKHEVHRKSVVPAEAGNAYSLAAIPPGQYKIVAFAVAPREWSIVQSLEFLQKLDSKAEPITVAANAKLTKTLKLQELPDE